MALHNFLAQIPFSMDWFDMALVFFHQASRVKNKISIALHKDLSSRLNKAIPSTSLHVVKVNKLTLLSIGDQRRSILIRCVKHKVLNTRCQIPTSSRNHHIWTKFVVQIVFYSLEDFLKDLYKSRRGLINCLLVSNGTMHCLSVCL